MTAIPPDVTERVAEALCRCEDGCPCSTCDREAERLIPLLAELRAEWMAEALREAADNMAARCFCPMPWKDPATREAHYTAEPVAFLRKRANRIGGTP